jgi:HlyD family secretion protein
MAQPLSIAPRLPLSLPALRDAPWDHAAEAALPERSLRRIALVSLVVVAVGFGGLVAWAALTTVESAVPATGFVVSSGKRKTVSLLESGILRTLLVGEGDKVAAGQVLLQMDDAQVQVTRSQATVQYWAAVARATRLAAEAMDRRDLPFPQGLIAAAATNPDIAAAMQAEAYQFSSRWGALDATVRVQERKIAQSQAQIAALRAQIEANITRLSLTRQELVGVDFLVEKGLATKSRQLDLRRTEADFRGQIGALEGQVAQTQQAIAQGEMEIISTTETRRSDISRERTETQAARADAEQRLTAANDLLQKRVITAPEAGTVTDIKFFTPGSSIGAGQPVMDLVPEASTLLIEASVPPNEVEHLAPGQRVNVKLTAYKAHKVPVIPGRLVYVGADRQVDAANQSFFLIRAAIDKGALADKPSVVLTPGMPADVLVINGERSVLDFLISPITDSLRHSLKEE